MRHCLKTFASLFLIVMAPQTVEAGDVPIPSQIVPGRLYSSMMKCGNGDSCEGYAGSYLIDKRTEDGTRVRAELSLAGSSLDVTVSARSTDGYNSDDVVTMVLMDANGDHNVIIQVPIRHREFGHCKNCTDKMGKMPVLPLACRDTVTAKRSGGGVVVTGLDYTNCVNVPVQVWSKQINAYKKCENAKTCTHESTLSFTVPLDALKLSLSKSNFIFASLWVDEAINNTRRVTTLLGLWPKVNGQVVQPDMIRRGTSADYAMKSKQYDYLKLEGKGGVYTGLEYMFTLSPENVHSSGTYEVDCLTPSKWQSRAFPAAGGMWFGSVPKGDVVEWRSAKKSKFNQEAIADGGEAVKGVCMTGKMFTLEGSTSPKINTFGPKTKGSPCAVPVCARIRVDAEGSVGAPAVIEATEQYICRLKTSGKLPSCSK